MAIKEARCGNCGSIIRVDEKAERAVCIFCGAKTPTAEALAIQKNPEGHDFPHEEQAELTEEERKEALSGHRGAGGKYKAPVVAAAPRAAHPAQPSAAERVAQLESKPVEIKPLTLRTILFVALGVVLFVGVIVALILPPFFNREQKREALKVKIKEIVPAEVAAADQRYMIEGQDNRHLRVIAPAEVTEEQAEDLATKFRMARAEVYGLPADDPQSKTVVDLFSEEKSYRVTATDVKEVVGINPASIVKEKAAKGKDQDKAASEDSERQETSPSEQKAEATTTAKNK